MCILISVFINTIRAEKTRSSKIYSTPNDIEALL